jgi:hypothetical protein
MYPSAVLGVSGMLPTAGGIAATYLVIGAWEVFKEEFLGRRNMDFKTTFFIWLIFPFVSIALSVLVRNQKISAIKAAVATTISLIGLTTINLYIQKFDDLLLGWFCINALFVMGGVISYFPYRMLEVMFGHNSQKQ